MADKKYTKLPAVHQTPVIKNFFDTTVEQLFSKANVETVSAYIGRKEESIFDSTDTYVLQPTVDRDRFSLEPVVNTIDTANGTAANRMFYEDYLNVLKSYGVNTLNQNTLFDTDFYTWLPPINIDKFINYQEYFWSPNGPTAKNIAGTASNPINIEKDIIGKKTYTAPDGTVFKNGMIVSFSGNYVIPTSYMNEKRFIVEGVGDSIILFDKEQNYSTVFATEDYIPYDSTIIDEATDTLLSTSDFLSGGLSGLINTVDSTLSYYYEDSNGQRVYTTSTLQTTPSGEPMWQDYVTPIGSALRYIAGGDGSFDTQPFDSDNTQEVPDYIMMQRGSKDNNVWSRINFWHHMDNFIDAGDQLPPKSVRAQRPIIEFDRDLELYNFGKLGKDSVEISGEGILKSDVVGRPNGATIDDVTLEVGNRIIFPNEDVDIAKYIYEIGTDGSENATLTQVPNYTATVGDVITVKFGSNFQGVEYYWTGSEWKQGQKKSKVNTPILFQGYDYKGNTLDDESVYPNSSFKGTKLFAYTESTLPNSVDDPVLGFPLKYVNFNNFSEIEYTNHLDTDLISYIPFGGTDKNYVNGYVYYKKVLPNNNIEYNTMWKSLDKKIKQHVADRYIVKDNDVNVERLIWELSAKPIDFDSNVVGATEKNIRVYINGKREKTFSYNSINNAVQFASWDLKKGDILDFETKTNSGYILSDNTDGRYNIPLSWHSNLDNKDVVTISQPQYLEHFRDLVSNQEDISGDPLGGNNFDSIEKDNIHANKIVQTDEDLQMSAFLFSNDKFNLKDSLDYCSEEYIKYKNRLKKEINRYIDDSDISNKSYGEMLETVLENVIAFNQGKNVFDNTQMLSFGDKFTEEKIVINNVLKKQYILDSYLDLEKIENKILIYDQNASDIDQLLCVDYDYTINSKDGVVTIDFTDSYTLTLGNTITVKLYDVDRESAQVPPTPSAMGMYPVYYPEIYTDNSFVEPIKMIKGHDGSKTIAVNDTQDYILLEFEKRIYNGILQDYRDRDSVPDLNVFDIRPGRFRDTGRTRQDFYALMRSRFNFYVARNEVDFVKNEYYDADNYWTWNYNSGQPKPAHWRGIYEACYDTERPHTHPWEMLGFIKKPTWWEEQYGTAYGKTNKSLWSDLEEGIIRQGNRENVTNNRYKQNNPYRRIGLKFELPVDDNGNLLPPANIVSTTSTTKTISWSNTETGTATANANSFIKTIDGLSVSELSNKLLITTNNIVNHTTGTYPSTNNTNFIEDKELTYEIHLRTGENPTSSYANAVSTSNTIVGIAVNGAVITNANTGVTHSDSSSFTYDSFYRNEVDRDNAGGSPDSNNIYGYVQPSPQTVGLTEWSTTEHSPIVGWSLDGFPIYGPYGYEDRANVSSSIVRLESGYSLKTTNRDNIATGVGGLPTGEFIEDYEWSSNSHGLDQYNGRYGPTPEFPNGTYYYVATIDENSNPAYPYTVGPSFADTSVLVTENNAGNVTHSTGTATYQLSSVLSTTYSSDTSLTGKDWKFSDGAPVENAWKMSEGYPFAVVESLLLAKPGKFASVFVDPRKIIRASTDTNQLLDKTTLRRAKTKKALIHGDVTSNNETILTTGYTQFIDAFLKFQGLETKTEFAPHFRTVNSKLGHKFAGFIDKDTMTVFSDSYSTTGNSSSLILPQEDIDVSVHVGPYSTTNDYTGVMIELTEDSKYKVSGYNSVKRHFDIEESDINGPKTEVSVGGEPADFSQYDVSANYQAGLIVRSGYNYYRSKKFAGAGSSVTDTTVWERLASLPTVGGAEATYYVNGTGVEKTVEYGTEYETVAEVFDFLISLGRKQKSMGYNFGEFNADINDLNDWLYSGKQFLFWSIGKWAAGNTINLSPAASGIKFIAPIGRVSAIIDVDQGQYSLLDEEGKAIRANECEIIRDANTLEIRPPEGKQLYGLILYTNEIEHAMVISNKTIFGDTIYDDVFNQRQPRLKIKGKRTKNWNGTLTAEGFVITQDGLKPNFDTLAADMGKYNEIGHVPVEKHVYEASRRQYGYQERKYLREFELTQDDQYDFYVGMIRSKGTKNSLEVLLNSDKVLVPGSVNVYDEWALKYGDFGDVENYQTVDMKITKSEITDERQLIQIAYPEDIVSKVGEVEVLDRTTKFFQKPFLEIEPPPAEIPGSFTYGGGTTAQATVNIGTDGRISDVVVTEPGYGYTVNPSVTVIAAQLLTANITTYFAKPFAVSTSYVENNGDLANIGFSIANIQITDHFAPVSNASTVIDLSSANTVEDVANAINLNANVNANISATSIRVGSEANGSIVENFTLNIKGDDFTLADVGNTLANVLHIEPKRYQPRQRYSFQTANSTQYNDVVITVDGEATTGGNVGASGVDWVFDPGSRTTINTTGVLEGNASFTETFTPVSISDGITATDEIAADNLTILNGSYPHIDIEINGAKLPEEQEEALFTLTSNTSAGTSTLFIPDVGKLPGGRIPATSKIDVIEKATIDLEDTYQGDLPGSTMNIKVFASDALAAKLIQVRTYEIYPDDKSDSTILIDVDDKERLVTRPTDMSEKDLWPTTTKVDSSGITDKRYDPLPNAGYVSKYNVGYQAFDINDYERLFDRTRRSGNEIPKKGDFVHFAKGEHEEFDVYKISNVDAKSYLKFDEDAGTTFLWSNVSLSNLILDNNTFANTDNTYDQTKWYDQVLTFKGKQNIDDYHANLVTAEGNPLFDPTLVDITSPVTLFVSEEKVSDNAIEVGDVAYTIPDIQLIDKIEPYVSGNITQFESVVLDDVGVPARAKQINPITDAEIFRNVDATYYGFRYNNQLTFTINNGKTEGVAVGDFLQFHDSGSSNLNANIFQVARVSENGNVDLYSNSVVIGNMTTVSKDTLHFVNFGKTGALANTTNDYAIQVFAQEHELLEGQKIKFDVDNLGKSAGGAFDLYRQTTNTFFINADGPGATANASLDVLQEGNVSRANTTVEITTIPWNTPAIYDYSRSADIGNKVTFKDSSGSNLDSNTYTITNVFTKSIPYNKALLEDATESQTVLANVGGVVQDNTSGAVTNSNVVTLSGDLTNGSVQVGQYLSAGPDTDGNNEIGRIKIIEVNADTDRRVNRKVYPGSNVSNNTLRLSNTTGIRVNDLILLTGEWDEESNVRVSSISGNNVTLINQIISNVDTVHDSTVTTNSNQDFDDLEKITTSTGTIFYSGQNLTFVHEGTNTIGNVILEDNVTLSANQLVDITSAEFTVISDSSTEEFRDVVCFEIETEDFNAGQVNEKTLSYVVNQGLKVTTDADLSNLKFADTTYGTSEIKIIDGQYAGFYKLRDLDTANSTFTVWQYYQDPYAYTTTAARATESNVILLSGQTTSLFAGMNVEGANTDAVPTNTIITEIINDISIRVSNNVSLTIGDNLTIYQDSNTTFVGDELHITTREEHNFEVGNFDPIVDKTVNIYYMVPGFYNHGWKIREVVSNTVVKAHGFAIGHPYVDPDDANITYVDEDSYIFYGTDAPTTSGDPDFVPYFVASHTGNITINGADIVTNVYPWHSIEQYADDIRDQMAVKAGYVSHVGSFSLNLPFGYEIPGLGDLTQIPKTTTINHNPSSSSSGSLSDKPAPTQVTQGPAPFTPQTSCPAPEMPIRISALGDSKPAGDLQVGDKVYTAHEDTGDFGLYNVEYVEIKQEQRTKIVFDNDFEFIGSLTHKFKVDDEWIEVQELNVGDVVQGKEIVSIQDDVIGDIVVITVTDAHTYIVGELLSHNKTPKQTLPPPPVIDTSTPKDAYPPTSGGLQPTDAEAIAMDALQRALALQNAYIVPGQQQAVTPAAYDAYSSGSSGMSMGGPVGFGVTGSGVGTNWGQYTGVKGGSSRPGPYGAGTKYDQPNIFNWNTLAPGDSITLNGVTYTKTDDGLIKGDDGSVYATDRARFMRSGRSLTGPDGKKYPVAMIRMPTKARGGVGARYENTLTVQGIQDNVNGCPTVAHVHNWQPIAGTEQCAVNPRTGYYEISQDYECVNDGVNNYEACDLGGFETRFTGTTCSPPSSPRFVRQGWTVPSGTGGITEGPMPSNTTAGALYFFEADDTGVSGTIGYTISGVSLGDLVDINGNPIPLTGTINFQPRYPGNDRDAVGYLNAWAITDSNVEDVETATIRLDNTWTDAEGTVIDAGNELGGADLLIFDDGTAVVTYSLSIDKANYEEGEQMTITVSASNVPDNTTVDVTLSGNVTYQDFDNETANTKTFTLTNGTASHTVTISTDETTESPDPEDGVLTLAAQDSAGNNTGTLTQSFTIKDTSKDPVVPPETEQMPAFYYDTTGGTGSNNNIKGPLGFTEDTNNGAGWTIKWYFDNYSAKDNHRIFASKTDLGPANSLSYATLAQQATMVASSKFNVSAMTSNDVVAFKNLVGEATDNTIDIGTSLSYSKDSNGYFENKGTLSWNYKPSNGSYIYIVTDRGSGSSVHKWGLKFPAKPGYDHMGSAVKINAGETDDRGTTSFGYSNTNTNPGLRSGGRSGTSGAVINTNTANLNTANASRSSYGMAATQSSGINYQKSGAASSAKYSKTNNGNPVPYTGGGGVGGNQIILNNIFYDTHSYAHHKPLPQPPTKLIKGKRKNIVDTAKYGAQTGGNVARPDGKKQFNTFVRPAVMQYGGYTTNETVDFNSYTNPGVRGKEMPVRKINGGSGGPTAGKPSYIGTAGPRPAVETKIPDNSSVIPDIDPQNIIKRSPTMKITPLKKNEAGDFVTHPAVLFEGDGTIVSLDANCNKPRWGFCGDTSVTGDTTVGYLDQIIVNSTPITFQSNTISGMAAEIAAALGDTADVNVFVENGVQCLNVVSKNNQPNTTYLRNGCKGGNLKEVLDFTTNRDANKTFGETTVQAGSVTQTNTVTTKVSADTDMDANTEPVHVGDVSTTSTGTDIIYNTTTAQDRIGQDRPSSISMNFHGSNYRVGHKLRAVGGVAVQDTSLPTAVVNRVLIVDGGQGYGEYQDGVGYVMSPQIATQLIKLRIGGSGQSGTGAKAYINQLTVDPVTGALRSTNPPNSDGLYYLDMADKGAQYIQNNPPTVAILGNGNGARMVADTRIFDADGNDITGATQTATERVAVFEVTGVDNQGAITKLAVLDRGLYQTFPGDLNSGIPLEYNVDSGDGTAPGGGQNADGENLRHSGAQSGQGARVFMTARLVGDCREKSTVLEDLGLEEGPVATEPFEKFLVGEINKGAPLGPDGFPLFNAQIVDGPGGPEFVLGGDDIDGFRIEGGAPGDLEGFGLTPGDYVGITPPDIDVVDGGASGTSTQQSSGDSSGPAAGEDRGKSIRFSSQTPFNFRSDIGNTSVTSSEFKYELRRLDGVSPVLFTSDRASIIGVDTNALESFRHTSETGLDLANISNVWIDSFVSSYTDSDGKTVAQGEWAYLENGKIVRKQEKLVDTRFIKDVFTYDEDNAEKEFDIDLYDPFKGILPGFIDKEIDFKSERDPVVYDVTKGDWGRKNVGLRWLDTSLLRYQWYEQGAGVYSKGGFNNYERSRCWGEMFPNSRVQIAEWVESVLPPASYDGPGVPYTREFITEVHPGKNGEPVQYYYFWAFNLDEVSDRARSNYNKERTTVELTNLMQNINGERVAYTGILSPDSLVVNTLGDLIKTEDSILSIAFNRKDNPIGEKHTSWSLAGEGDRDGVIPENLSIKLIHSLAGYNDSDQVVPGEGLSNFERFGSKFRPRQTMFKDLKKARKQMFDVLNDIFARLKMDSTFLDWRNNLPSSTPHLNTVNWYEVLRVNKVNNSTVYYDNTFKPLRKVTDTKQFDLLANVLDKSIVQVQKNNSANYSLYEFNKKDGTYKLIAMQDETVAWDRSVYTNSQTLAMGQEIRDILKALYEDVFVGTYSIHWNKFFFEMLKYAFAEQGELDWAFKTTYLKIIKEETDLIPFKGFKVDNFDKAIDYFNEVKPYSSKIRNYSDIKKAPVENLIGSSTDFDRPPYYDDDLNVVRILDRSNSSDYNILSTDKNYDGFINNSDKVRTFNQEIIFDRVKGDLYENTTGGSVAKILADGTTTIFNYPFGVEDSSRLQVFVNGILVPQQSTSGGNTVNNYTVDLTNNFVTFTNDANINNRIGIPANGDKVEIKYIDGFDPTLETVNVSIAKNIVGLEGNSNTTIANTQLKYTAPERLWKFDSDVREAVTKVFEDKYGLGSASNTTITTNLSIVTDLVESGNFNTAFNLIKNKVHASFQGEYLDANVFTDVVPGTHPSTFYTDSRGFDTFGWDDGLFDREVEVENFIGIFSEDASGNVNYRINDETIYGFDGVTFLKSRYGPDRPEELAVVQPLETLIIDVTTKGNSQISSSSTDVRFILFQDLFGRTEYYRRNVEPIATVSGNVEIWDNEISFVDVTNLPNAAQKDRAVIWIQGERIEYEEKDAVNNKIKGIIRGTKGTSPNTVILSGAGAYNGEETENIRLRDANGNLLRDPEDWNWIKPVEIYDDTIPFDDDWDESGALTVTSTANINYANVTYDADNGNVSFGFDPVWDGTGQFQIDDYGYTLTYDVDESDGWDSGDRTFKESGSLTDKGTVLQANTSIIDFLHNFDE